MLLCRNIQLMSIWKCNTYKVRYKAVSAATWTTATSASNSVVISGLSPETNYEAQVRSICPTGSSSIFSSSKLFTTLADATVTYCTSKGNSIVDEWKILGLKCKSGFDSQALIQLKTKYCSNFKCLDCKIGHEIMNLDRS